MQLPAELYYLYFIAVIYDVICACVGLISYCHWLLLKSKLSLMQARMIQSKLVSDTAPSSSAMPDSSSSSSVFDENAVRALASPPMSKNSNYLTSSIIVCVGIIQRLINCQMLTLSSNITGFKIQLAICCFYSSSRRGDVGLWAWFTHFQRKAVLCLEEVETFSSSDFYGTSKLCNKWACFQHPTRTFATQQS